MVKISLISFLPHLVIVSARPPNQPAQAPMLYCKGLCAKSLYFQPQSPVLFDLVCNTQQGPSAKARRGGPIIRHVVSLYNIHTFWTSVSACGFHWCCQSLFCPLS